MTTKPVLSDSFTLRSYRDVDHLPTLVEALNRGFEGLLGHHRTTEAEFASRTSPELDWDGTFIPSFRSETVALPETAGAELAPDLSERNGVLSGRVSSPGVVSEKRTLELYGALLLSGVDYLKDQGAVRAELQSWGDAPETVQLYTSLGFKTVHQQVAYQREAS